MPTLQLLCSMKYFVLSLMRLPGYSKSELLGILSKISFSHLMFLIKGIFLF